MGRIIPYIVENKRCSKPPTRSCLDYVYMFYYLDLFGQFLPHMFFGFNKTMKTAVGLKATVMRFQGSRVEGPTTVPRMLARTTTFPPTPGELLVQDALGEGWNMVKYDMTVWQDMFFVFFWVYFCLLSLLCFFSVRSLNGECTRLNLEKKTMGSTSMGKTLLHAIDQVKYSTQRESLPLL